MNRFFVSTLSSKRFYWPTFIKTAIPNVSFVYDKNIYEIPHCCISNSNVLQVNRSRSIKQIAPDDVFESGRYLRENKASRFETGKFQKKVNINTLA